MHTKNGTLRPGMAALAAAAILTSTLHGQITSVAVSAASAQQPNEVSIAIHPLDPNTLVAGSNLRYFYRSTDGGGSWTQSELPAGTWGDPSVAFDALGRLYYAHLANLTGGSFIDRLIVHRSTTAGASWTDSAEVGYNPPVRAQDKEWIVADQTGSPRRNSVYMAWTQFDRYGSSAPADSTRILFARTTDGGATWSPPVRVSDAAGNCLDDDGTVEGAVPAVGPEGDVFLAWSGPLGIMADRSTDGGLTWGTDRLVSDQPGGWNFTVPGISRCNGFPVTLCDASPSPRRGTVYVVWSDQRNGLDNTDIFLVRSTDRGATWSAPLRVNNDLTVSHQFFPWAAIDQTDGSLWFVFYDRRQTSGQGTDVFVARSSDGGASFANTRVNQPPFTPDSRVFFGDYTGIAADRGRAHPIWMRMDARKNSIWTAAVTPAMLTGVADAAPIADAAALSQNYPNPFNPSTTIGYRVPGPGVRAVRLSVYDLLGREVAVLAEGDKEPGDYSVRFDTRRYGVKGLASGVYVYRLAVVGPDERGAAPAVQERRMLLVR